MLKQSVKNLVATAKMGRAFVQLVRNPKRLDVVFELSDGLDNRPDVLEPIKAAFEATDTGREALAARRRVRIDLPALEALGDETLGSHYASFIRREGLDPAVLFRHVDVRHAYDWVSEHFFETHDIWHTVTGFGTDEAGELGLQAFYLAQFPARLATLLIGAGMLNTFLFSFDDRDRRMDEIARGWSMGKQASSFLGVDWASMWSTPIEEVRHRLGVSVSQASLAA